MDGALPVQYIHILISPEVEVLGRKWEKSIKNFLLLTIHSQIY